MYQPPLPVFEEPLIGRVVNVATVPQRSPFRYPGGKTWLVPYIRRWLTRLPVRPVEMIEPFAGGAIVGLTAVFEGYVDRVTLVELDEEVAAVWQTILDENGGGQWLADEILRFDLTPESVRAVLSTPARSLREKAFRTILKNRVNRGGILAQGAGLVRHGEDGKGLRSRWYPLTLRKRILDIVAIRDRIRFVHGDGMEVWKLNSQRPDAVFFIDPPYTAGGKMAGIRLYSCSELDHEELFRISNGLKGDFLMTYDSSDEIAALAHRYGLSTLLVRMKNTHHTRMNELLIGRSVDWAQPAA